VTRRPPFTWGEALGALGIFALALAEMWLMALILGATR
jgi:hypothetical protein